MDVNVPVQWLRSVGHSHTAFAVECFIDELAGIAQKDPYQFRRALLQKQPRYLGVLDLAAQKADWGRNFRKAWAANRGAFRFWQLLRSCR